MPDDRTTHAGTRHVEVRGVRLRFAAAHMATLEGELEPLHGHNYSVACRVEGELFALDVRCPHEGGMIVDGPLIDGRFALCPLHHYLFDPRTGRQKDGFCGPARRYRLVERDGVATLYER